MPGPSVPGGLRGEAAGAAETPRPGWEATGEEAPRLINGAARPPARPPAACLRLSTRTTRGARLRVWRTVPPTQGEAAGRGALGSRPWRRGGTGALRAWGPMCQCGRGKPGPGAFCRNRAGPTASELTVHAGELPPRPGSARPHRGRERKRKPHCLLLTPRRLWPKHGPLLEGQQVPPRALSTRTPACFPSAITPGFGPVKAPRLRHGLIHLLQEATGLRGGHRPWQRFHWRPVEGPGLGRERPVTQVLAPGRCPCGTRAGSGYALF